MVGGGYQPAANYTTGSLITNAHLDSLNMTVNETPAFIGYIGTPGTSTTPKVTYSTTAMSKSYSPATTLGQGLKQGAKHG